METLCSFKYFYAVSNILQTSSSERNYLPNNSIDIIDDERARNIAIMLEFIDIAYEIDC